MEIILYFVLGDGFIHLSIHRFVLLIYMGKFVGTFDQILSCHATSDVNMAHINDAGISVKEFEEISKKCSAAAPSQKSMGR